MLLIMLVLAATPVVGYAQVAPVGASAQVHDASGKLLAVAAFRQASDQVTINLTFPDRAALSSTHAIQIHQFARCDAPDFSSAGPIFNPSGKQHGLLNPNGPMDGDLPSLVISTGGVAVYNISAPLVTLGPGPNSLLAPPGSSLVIFANADDDTSQPEGNAGARIACGVIVAGAPPPVTSGPLAGATDSRPDAAASVSIALLGGMLIGGGLLLRRRR